jgi:hypothetical protein
MKIDTLVLGTFIILVVAWPVFFFLIRQHARETGRGGGWRHAAFFLGPVGAALIFLFLKLSDHTPTSKTRY